MIIYYVKPEVVYSAVQVVVDLVSRNQKDGDSKHGRKQWSNNLMELVMME